MRCSLLLLALLVGCGRTDVDARVPPPPPPAPPEPALRVFVGDPCPTLGTESDLFPAEFDGLVVVRMKALVECSGAGGNWFVGRALDAKRDFFVGQHACFFHTPVLDMAPGDAFAVVRYSPTAALFRTPEGWCIRDEDGKEPVTTDSKSIAWGEYRTEAGARAAYARLEAARP